MARAAKTLLLLFIAIVPLVLIVERQKVEYRQALAQGEVTAEFIDPERTPEPPTPTPVVSPDVRLWLDIREDLETLAEAARPDNSRPVGWSGVNDPFNSDIALLTRLDLELLATSIINPEQRPRGWIGAIASGPYYVARDARHDLELLADLFFGTGQRPEVWRGGDPLFNCNRATQTLVSLLERGGVYRLQIAPNDPEFCRKAELEVTQFAEINILENAQVSELFADDLIILAPNSITSDVALAWLDSTAVRQVGVVPLGEPIQVVARSYATFSNMMLISGDGFQVFVEYPSTTVTDTQFRRLPNINSIDYSTYCFADWCTSGN